MLSCCAGICGKASLGASSKRKQAHTADEPRSLVIKPVVRCDEIQSPACSFDDLVARFEMQLAPPGASEPIGVVTKDFQKNASRLLVLVPAAGAPPGSFDPAQPHGSGDAVMLLRWATANGYSVAIFSAAALSTDPVKTWDGMLRGSPAKTVSVVVATGQLSLLQEALSCVHPLLFARFRNICVCDGATGKLASSSVKLSVELRVHLRNAVVAVPPISSGDLGPLMVHQSLFELLRRREEGWQQNEMNKYAGFQNLKENDMPGLKRLPLDQRIQRLDRNRNDDELARLLQKHEKDAGVEGEEDLEPGVD